VCLPYFIINSLQSNSNLLEIYNIFWVKTLTILGISRYISRLSQDNNIYPS